MGPAYADEIRDAFKRRMEDLVTDFHKAARILNPEYGAAPRDPSVKKAFISVISKMLSDDPAMASKRNKMLETELPAFLERTGFFADEAARSAEKVMLPHRYWSLFGEFEAPNLKPLAVRILAQVSGSGDAERNWKTWSYIKSHKRVRLGSDTANKLVHLHCFLRMRDNEDEDLDRKQMREWWEMNDKLPPRGSRPRASRAFKAYVEEWEPELIESAKENLNAQRRLEAKYKNTYIMDKDDGTSEDNYYRGLITGVEYVKAGYDTQTRKRFAGGWRAAVTGLELLEDGSWGVPKDGGTSVNMRST